MSGERNHNITVNKGTGRLRVIPESVSREAYPKAWEEYEVPTSSSHPRLDAALKRWHAEQAEIEAEEAMAAALEEDKGHAAKAAPPPSRNMRFEWTPKSGVASAAASRATAST